MVGEPAALQITCEFNFQQSRKIEQLNPVKSAFFVVTFPGGPPPIELGEAAEKVNSLSFRVPFAL
jgi:hypothetical protein